MSTCFALRCGCIRIAILAGFAIGWLIAPTAQSALAEVVERLDFEAPGLSQQWAAAGGLRAERLAVPEPPSDAGGPQGFALRVAIEKPGAIYTKPAVLPTDWRPYRAWSAWIYRSAEEAKAHPTSTFEVRAVEDDGRANYWRKVEVSHTGWKLVELPLPWFRTSDGRLPRWNHIARLVLASQTPIDLVFDDIRLIKGDRPRAAELTPEILTAFAFPAEGPRARTASARRVFIATTADELDLDVLAPHLEKVAAAVYEQLPFVSEPTQPGILLVFRTRDEYRDFVVRLARQFGGVADRPSADGFTVQAIASSYWEPRLGTLRPVYTHEFTHALVEQALLLRCKGEWFHEGLANSFQIRFHPQKNIDKSIIEWLDSSNSRSPLADVCSGKPVPIERYWQTLTVAQMLFSEEKYRAKLPDLVKVMQATGSTDLEPPLKSLWNSDWEAFTSDWEAFCRRKYQPAGNP